MASGANIVVDLERWPVVNTLFTGMLDDPDIEALFTGLNNVLKRRAPFLMIADARGLKGDNPKGARHRAEIAKFMKEHQSFAATYCVGMTLVLHSPTVAMGLRAICALVRPPVPIHSVGSPRAAATWSADKLKEHALLTEPLDQWLAGYRGW